MTMVASWTRNHILDLTDWRGEELDIVLQTATTFQQVLSGQTKKVPALQGQVVTNLFF